MNNPRTSHAKIQGRYYLLTLPVGIFFGIMFGPFGLIFFVVYMVVQFIFFNTVAKTNELITKKISPKAYNNIKKAGAHSFYDNLGAPLNFDSNEVRHAQPTLICPNCSLRHFEPTNATKEFLCSCGYCYCDGRWFYVENNQWTPIQDDEDEELIYEEYKNPPNNNYWNGKIGRI